MARKTLEIVKKSFDLQKNLITGTLIDRGVTRGGDIGDMSPQLFDRGGQSIRLSPPTFEIRLFLYRTLIFIKEKYDSNIEKTRAG